MMTKIKCNIKKVLSILISVSILASVFAGLDFSAYAQTLSGSCGENVTYTLDTGSGLLTISGTGPMTNYSSSFDVPWYNNSSSVKTVKIEYGVTSIGYRAFYVCNSLTSVTIPNSVTSIGRYAFQDCSSLTNVTIPSSVTSIGDYAFRDCDSLTSIIVDSNNQYYSSQDGVLFNKDKTTLIQYPIGNSRTSYIIPSNVTVIVDNAFSKCDSLTSVTIPNSVTSIGFCAFYSTSRLTSITVDNNNQYYSSQDGVLFNKAKSTLIQYPIGNSRTSYMTPNIVTSVESYAFYKCSSLTSITIPNSVTSIGSGAFEGCSSLTSITIPNSVTSISSHAFRNCSSLRSVTIPSSVANIGYEAFRNCSSLTSITIPNSVTSISSHAFWNCSSLTSVTIGNGLTSIDFGSFHNCSSLTSVTIPNSVTSVGGAAFEDCSSLTSVTIPNSVTSIGSSAFSGCSSLTSVTIPNSVTSIGDWAFGDCDSLVSVTIPNSVTSIGDYAFYYCSSLTSITIPNSVTSIGDKAFAWCSSLASAIIPSSVKSIGDYAFYNCDSLTSITIPNSVTSIGDWAFRSCNSLTSIIIPNSVTSIGDSAFSYCSNDLTIFTSTGSYAETYANNNGINVDTSGKVWTLIYCDEVNSAVITNGGEIKYFKFVPTSTAIYNIESTGSSDTYVYLYDSNWDIIESDDDDGESTNFKITRQLTANTTYYIGVKYLSSSRTGTINFSVTKATFDITFDANGGNCSTTSKTVTSGNTYGSLPTPTRTGYTFAGWYTSSSGGTQITSSSAVSITANQTLYAHWTGNTYTVSFNANGGSCSTSSKSVTNGSTYGSLPTPTRTGYMFSGWYTSSSSGTQITSSSTVSITSNQTLYAHWTGNSYTVTFNANGGYSSQSSKSVTYGSTYGTLPTPTRSGYTFTGWYTSTSGGTQITSNSTVNLTSNQTLYAHWTVNNYTVYFNANGGNCSTSSKSVTYGSTYGTLPIPTRTGYTFTGWYSEFGTRIDESSIVRITSNQTLYAYWSANSYSVYFDANGGYCSTADKTVTYDYSYGSLPTPTRENFMFAGWYDAYGQSVTYGTSVKFAGDIHCMHIG